MLGEEVLSKPSDVNQHESHTKDGRGSRGVLASAAYCLQYKQPSLGGAETSLGVLCGDHGMLSRYKRPKNFMKAKAWMIELCTRIILHLGLSINYKYQSRVLPNFLSPIKFLGLVLHGYVLWTETFTPRICVWNGREWNFQGLVSSWNLENSQCPSLS